MDGRALTRLRIAFVLLGAALLLPLGILLRSVDARMEAQRRLRHELVAERIFDEMEGELTALLQREDARPTGAYDGGSTRVENWAPFVVGYFTRDERGAHIVARPQLASERLHRLEAALQKLPPSAERAQVVRQVEEQGRRAQAAAQAYESASPAALETTGDAESEAVPAREDKAAQRSAGDQYELAPTKTSARAKGIGARSAPGSGAAQNIQAAPEAVLKQLNRAADVREKTRPAGPSKKLSSDDNDPLAGSE